MIILGIDPGTASVGYALLECAGNHPHILEANLLTIRTPHAHERLMEIHKQIKKLIARWEPDAASIEKLFFAKNVKTAMAVSEARGVILLTALLSGIKVYEYTPLTIKKVVTGDGNADKAQVQKMVRMILKDAATLPSQDDVFDSIASALCCFYQEGRANRIV